LFFRLQNNLQILLYHGISTSRLSLLLNIPLQLLCLKDLQLIKKPPILHRKSTKKCNAYLSIAPVRQKYHLVGLFENCFLN
jgi:hypothetical protein